MKNILVVFGTRPEAIKLAPVIHEIHRRSNRFRCKICVTAQHRHMLDQVMELFGLKYDFDLNIMSPNQTLSQITIKALKGLEEVLRVNPTDIVLVQGDTTSTFCGALAGFYSRVKVGHVEAGLRSGNKNAPFPEEINRKIVTQLSDFHFAPTEHAKNSLIAEGVDRKSVFLTGNTVIDALLWVRDKVHRCSPGLPSDLLQALDGKELVLVTGHRRESFGQGFENICRAILETAESYADVIFIYPVHLNPRVREPVNRILRGHDRIRLIDPLEYASFVWLMDRASIILTDSGGVQEEAPSLGKPVLVMRETTERPEGIKAGNARLIGTQQKTIVDELLKLLKKPEERTKMTTVSNPYGDGKASFRIVDELEKTW